MVRVFTVGAHDFLKLTQKDGGGAVALRFDTVTQLEPHEGGSIVRCGARSYCVAESSAQIRAALELAMDVDDSEAP